MRSRIGRPAVGEVLQPLFLRDALATCAIVDLEVQFSARSPADYERLRTDQRALQRLPVTDDACERALDVQRRLARRSAHRGASIPVLLIAACAEANDVAVLHYDADFDLIAEVTGQWVAWVVPRGTVD